LPAPLSAPSIDRLFRLDGQVAIVTGGLGRLGSQYAGALASAGAAVALVDLPGRQNAAVRQLVEIHPRISVHAADATDRRAVDAAMDAIVRQHGTATILVNNAGLGSSPANAALETGPFERYPESAWDDMIDSHLKSALFMSQAFIARFKGARGANPTLAGSIINISSTYGVVSPDQSVYDYRRRDGTEYYKPIGYSVAKSGMLNFTRWLAEYCASFGVRVNTLVPGGVREDGHAPEFVAEYEKRTPLGRMARDDEYNGAIVFLASQASAYMTGAALVMDGGWTAK
jgi:NAD(P)-dependent dehydrogenase (short-subunit alcohol dehydrogenase family)